MTHRRSSIACSALLFAVPSPNLSHARAVDGSEAVERAIALHQGRAEQLRQAIDRVASIATGAITFGGETLKLTVRRR